MRTRLPLAATLAAIALSPVACDCEDDLGSVPGSLKGQFCEPESGAGIARVEVTLHTPDGVAVEGQTATGDMVGSFSLEKIDPGSYKVVGVRGELRREQDVVIESDKETSFKDQGCHDPPPPDGATVRGRVCNADRGEWVTFGTAWLSGPGNPNDLKYTANTDLDGVYNFTEVVPGTYDVHVEKDLFREDIPGIVAREGQTTEVPSPATCDPPPPGSIEGRACDEASGWVAGARAYVTLVGGSLLEGTTDANGTFVIQDVPPGDYTVVVEKDTFVRRWNVTVVTGETTHVASPLTCEPAPETGTVRGRVCGPDGHTWLALAHVFIGAEASPVCETTTDGDGRYVLVGVPPGSQTIRIVKGSVFSLEYTVNMPPNGDITIPDEDCQMVANITKIAVVTGQYDNVRCVLTGQADPAASRPGDPCTAAGLGIDPANVTSLNGEQNAWAASLLGNYAAMQQYDVIFFNCGLQDLPLTSGANASVYAANLRQYVQSGGSVYASDWAAPVVERAFPEFIQWQGTPGGSGAENIELAKVGDAQQIAATVTNAGIQAALNGRSTVQLNFDLPAWVVVKNAAASSRVYFRGTVTSTNFWTGAQTTLYSVPLTVGFNVGSGRAIYTSFHQERNITDDMATVLTLLVFEL